MTTYNRERREAQNLTGISIEIPRPLNEAFRAVAKANQRSMAGELRIVMERHIEQHRRAQERKAA